MKKYVFLILSLAFVACSKNKKTNHEQDILGKWALNHIIDYTNDAEAAWEHACSTKLDYYHFKDAENVDSFFYNKNCEEDKVFFDTYKIRGERLKIKDAAKENEYNFIIESISESKLILGTVDSDKSTEITHTMVLKALKD